MTAVLRKWEKTWVRGGGEGSGLGGNFSDPVAHAAA
jgi:hypothetical protein